jgi:hypothetical protein
LTTTTTQLGEINSIFGLPGVFSIVCEVLGIFKYFEEMSIFWFSDGVKVADEWCGRLASEPFSVPQALIA